MSKTPVAAGKSSFSLLEPEDLFAELPLRENQVILDAACGVGNYAVAVAQRLQDRAVIHAVDLWEEGIRELEKAVSRKGLTSVRPVLADLSRSIPLEGRSVDLCLMATALHDLVQVGTHVGALREIARVLKRGGTFALIEFRKIDPPPGPPLQIRLSSQELQEVLTPFGFGELHSAGLSPSLYLSLQRLQ
jgi:ubiquinone/menaquinone biosynthesis C-methylase UbiE